LVFLHESEAVDAENAFCKPGVFHISNTDVSSLDMAFVTGTISRRLDDETHTVWFLSVGYQEVSQF